jgi:SRSO17 transposase
MHDLALSERVTPSDALSEMLFEDFQAFHARFSSLFTRKEPREQAGKYLRTLLGRVERRNAWQMAEAMGDASPKPTQRLLAEAVWEADDARDVTQVFCVEEFGEPEGIGIVDETGFIKKGDESVGVARQYTGTAGKITNCQVGVFVGYASSKGSILLDRALYLPKPWCQDRSRLDRAKVPRGVRFYTKPTLAARMLGYAWEHGVPMRWVLGDEVYGNDPKLRDFVADHDRWFVLAVACSTRVWTERPCTEQAPRRSRRTTPSSRMRLVKGEPCSQRIDQIVASLEPTRWHRLITQYGEKGPIEHDWACLRVVESRNKLPGQEYWLLIRRSVTDPTDQKYYFSNAPIEASLQTLAWVASRRYLIEQCFEEAKDDMGMDQYEVRHWHGWYRHITLCMMALAWLVSLRAKANRAMAQAASSFTTPTELPPESSQTMLEAVVQPADCVDSVSSIEPELRGVLCEEDPSCESALHPLQVPCPDAHELCTSAPCEIVPPAAPPASPPKKTRPSTPSCWAQSARLPIGPFQRSGAYC